MDYQPSDLFQTAYQPDTVDDAYTFSKFNPQRDSEFDYSEFRPPTAWPTPFDSDRGEGGGGGVISSRSQFDGLAAGMGNLNFEETGDGFDYGKNDFMEQACKYCGISNPDATLEELASSMMVQ